MLFIAVVIVHVASCILLVVAVLLQSGKDAGLSGAFGLGGGQAIFGARTGDVLMKITVVLSMLFIITCLLFTRIRPTGSSSIVRTVPAETAAPAKPASEQPAPAPGGGAGPAGEQKGGAK
jgi:preprotein translocase subunit SecG